jgi:3,5-epimerase/4-reductase
MKTVFIFGSSGYFGSHFEFFFKEQGWKVIKNTVDISDYTQVEKTLMLHKPDVVINAAGKTGRPNVDWCESHKEETMKVNVQGSLNIASVCHAINIYCVHIGSGCIYTGDNNKKGFSEIDDANFHGSFYSRTKIYSENALKEFNPLQLRVRIPVEGKSHSKNVINKLLQYERIISEENSFTIVEDFLEASYQLIQRQERGIFNMTNHGSMDHKYLLSEYQKIVDPKKEFVFMSLKELAQCTKAPRSNCILNTEKLESLGIIMPDIKKRIPEILHNYLKSL